MNKKHSDEALWQGVEAIFYKYNTSRNGAL